MSLKKLHWLRPDLGSAEAAEGGIYLKEFVNNLDDTEGILLYIIMHIMWRKHGRVEREGLSESASLRFKSSSDAY